MHRIFEITIPNLVRFTIPAYALFAFIGLFFMMVLLYVRVKRIDLQFQSFLTLILYMAIGTGIGSKLLFILTKLPDMVSDFSLKNTLTIIWNSGFVFYGGLFGAIAGIYFFSRRHKLGFRPLLEIAAPGFPLFHMFGRIGCFFAGCCYGREARWGVPLQSEPDIPRIPVQLMESACLLLIFLMMLLLERVGKHPRRAVTFYFTAYPICRFILELFRGDTVRGIWFGLSTSQWISLALLASVLLGQVKERKNNNRYLC